MSEDNFEDYSMENNLNFNSKIKVSLVRNQIPQEENFQKKGKKI
jgi:hypothetical protein